MKKLVLGYRYFTVTLIVSISMFFSAGCQDALEERDSAINPADDYQEVAQWQDLLPDILNPNGIIVTKESSIQEAINAIEPGGVVYIEPGVYSEALTINKPDIALIGLKGNEGEEVVLENPGKKVKGIEVEKNLRGVEIRNIRLQNFTDNSIPEITSSARKLSYLRSMSRDVDYGNIAHYQFDIKVGDGPFDVVRLHRVVRERKPYRPVLTRGEIFMIHGANQDFDDIFYTAGASENNINPSTSSPVYLASQGIDVWGIDLGWTKVPIEMTDFGFMEDWGLYKDVDHTMRSLCIARLIRGLTGQGFGKMNLLGFSYGVRVAYAAAGEETKLRWFRKSIKGLVPADGSIKLDPKDILTASARHVACNTLASVDSLLATGNFENSQGAGFIFVSQLAISAPNDSSQIPDFKGLTNFQAALVGAVSPNPTQVPNWHFVSGEFAENGLPVGLAYTKVDRWFNLGVSLAPHMPNAIGLEVFGALCDTGDAKVDDYLADINIPIYYIGAGGGMGTFGEYTSTLTGSQDVTSNIVVLKPEGPRILDYGHADLWMANNAPELVWEPLRMWLLKH